MKVKRSQKSFEYVLVVLQFLNFFAFVANGQRYYSSRRSSSSPRVSLRGNCDGVGGIDVVGGVDVDRIGCDS